MINLETPLKIEMELIKAINNALMVKKSLRTRESKNKQIYFIAGLITALRILRNKCGIV